MHVAVVDPGVGSKRLPILISCERGILVGPDNGLLTRVAEKLGFQTAYRIENPRFSKNDAAATFHGRDVLAYTAAKVAHGSKPSEVGGQLSKLVRLDLPDVTMSKDRVTCCVLYVDSFGNVVLNVPGDWVERLALSEGVGITTKTRRGGRAGMFVRSYSDIPAGLVGLILGSQGYLELALREASAAKRLGLKPLDQLRILLS